MMAMPLAQTIESQWFSVLLHVLVIVGVAVFSGRARARSQVRGGRRPDSRRTVCARCGQLVNGDTSAACPACRDADDFPRMAYLAARFMKDSRLGRDDLAGRFPREAARPDFEETYQRALALVPAADAVEARIAKKEITSAEAWAELSATCPGFDDVTYNLALTHSLLQRIY